MCRLRLPAKIQQLSRIAVLIVTLLSQGLAWGQTFTEDFSSYAPESDAALTWEPQAAGWTVMDGAYQGDEGASVWQAVPWPSSVRFTCEVTVLEQFNGDWLTAGIEVTFWTNPQGGIHPDSRFAVNQELQPGKRWGAQQLPSLWVYGASRVEGWKQFATLSRQAREALIRANGAAAD